MESRKILRLVTSLLISIALWVYVINVVNPSSTTVVRNIPVTLTGTEELYEKNLAIDGSGKYTVDITLRGSRTDLSTISVDNIVATAESVPSLMMLVACGVGISVLYQDLAINAYDRLRFVPLEEVEKFRRYLMWDEESKNPALNAFIRCAEEHMAG